MPSEQATALWPLPDLSFTCNFPPLFFREPIHVIDHSPQCIAEKVPFTGLNVRRQLGDVPVTRIMFHEPGRESFFPLQRLGRGGFGYPPNPEQKLAAADSQMLQGRIGQTVVGEDHPAGLQGNHAV